MSQKLIIARNRKYQDTRISSMFFFQTLPLSHKVSQYLDFEQRRLVLPFLKFHINGIRYTFLCQAFFVQHHIYEIYVVTIFVVYSFSWLLCCQIIRFFPIRGSDKKCCNEHSYICLLVHTHIYALIIGYIYRNEIAGSKNSHIVSFSRYCQKVFQYGCVKYEYFKLLSR